MEATFQVTHTTHDDYPGFIQVWVGPKDSNYGLPCLRVPDQAVENDDLKEKINRLAIDIYLDYVASTGDTDSTSLLIDDGKWVDAEPN